MYQLGYLVVLVTLVGTWGAPEDIYLEEGGYKGILVAIHPSVEYDPSILPNLRSIFVSASETLYKATEYDIRISGNPQEGKTSAKHFSDITVLLPKTWPRLESCRDAKTELYDNADFRVEPDSQQWGKLMKTVMMNSECREPGLYTLVPESYVADTEEAREVYGDNLGMAIVHEWGYLRYGVHAESNEKQGGDSCQVMQSWNTYRYRQPLSCTRAIKGLRLVDPDDDTKCVFKPEPESSAVTARASIMYFKLPFYSNVHTFCDSRYKLDGELVSPVDEVLHDDEANTPHNHICGRKSVWQVLRDHPDFDPDNAGPLYPEFDFDWALNMTCIQQAAQLRIVLVLDVSGSMNDEGRLEQMIGDVALFIKSLPYDQAVIGINQFSTSATRLIGMTPLDSDENRDRLLDAIPTSAQGWTCIGCGIQLALQMLEEDGGNAAGGLIMVFTDGEETLNQGLHPTVKEINATVIEKEGIVHGLLMAGVTDDHDLIKLAVESKGDFCIFEDTGAGGTDYYQCLTDVMKGLGDYAAVEIKTDDFLLRRGESDEGDATIDASFNDNLRYTLSWKPPSFITKARSENDVVKKSSRSTACDNWQVILTSPDGSTITEGDERYVKQDKYFLITIDASGFQSGNWSYKVQNNNFQNNQCPSRLRIEGFPETTSSNDEDQPILLSASLSKQIVNVNRVGDPMDNVVSIYASLRQGLSPILFAEVKAEIEAGSNKWTLDLYDNGAGADLEADDGIYSRYFYNYVTNGAYSVRVSAKGQGGKVTILRETRGLFEDRDTKGFRVMRQEEKIPYETFERVSLGGAFDVSGASGDMDALFPPSRISDFRVEGSVTDEMVALEWTAPGQSMDDGTASFYHLSLCRSSQQLRDNFTTCYSLTEDDLTLNTTLISPKEAGSMEHIVVNPTMMLKRYIQWANASDGEPQPILNGTYFLAVKAVDAYSNEGAVSNIVSVFFEDPNYTEGSNTVAIVLGTLAGVCVLAGAIIGGLFFYRRRASGNTTV